MGDATCPHQHGTNNTVYVYYEMDRTLSKAPAAEPIFLPSESCYCQGGEMIYILDQRLHAQAVANDKSHKGDPTLPRIDAVCGSYGREYGARVH